jgi:hypothetical protein
MAPKPRLVNPSGKARSSSRPPQPLRAGWSTMALCHAPCWSLCEERLAGNGTLRAMYCARVVGTISGPTLASTAACPLLTRPAMPESAGCSP